MGRKRKVYLVKRCLVCDKEFTPSRSWQVYCCQAHQLKNYNLIHDVAGRLRKDREKKVQK